MNKSKQITEGALLTAVYIVLLLVMFFIPILQLVGIFVLPVPYVIYAARYGYKPSIIMAILTLLLTVLFATIFSLPMTLFASIGGIIIGYGIYKKKNAYDIWLRATVGYTASLVLIIVLLQFVFSINIFDEFNTMVDDIMEMMRTMTSQLSLGTDVDKQLNTFEDQMRQFPDLIPSTMIILSILFAWISQWISYKVINRLDRKRLTFPPFRQLNFPPSVLWLYFLVFLVSFIDLEQGSVIEVVVLNAMALLSILLVIQGLSFIFFFADYKELHKAFPIIVVVVTIFIPFVFLFLIQITGIIDLGFGLKERISKNKT